MDDKTKGIGVERTSGRSDEYISGREALDTDGRIGERGTSRIPSRSSSATGAGTSGDTTRNLSTDEPVDERTREIREEIEQTRGEMSETVNAIQDRLRPGNIAANAADSVKNTVRSVASEKAQVVTDRARDMADSEPVQYVRANPIPTAMIGIGIAGLTWLALGGRDARPSSRYRSGRTSRDWRRLAPYTEDDRYYRGRSGYSGYAREGAYSGEAGFGDAGFGETGYPGQGGYETASAYNPDLSQGSRGYSSSYGNARDTTGSGGSSWTGEVGQEAQDVGRRAQQTTRRAQRTVQRAWQQNPLMMGAASAVLGLIVGMAVPQTEIENEYMGEARDNAIEGVQQTVRDTVNKVQDAATSAVGLVSGQNTQQQGSSGDRGSSNPNSGQPGGGAGTSSGAASPPAPQAGRKGENTNAGQQPGSAGQHPKTPGVV
jgi:uncharacterized protein DUF3618